MAKKITKSVLPEAVASSDKEYVFVGTEAGQKEAESMSGKALDSYQGIQNEKMKALASNYFSFIDVDTNINARTEFNRLDYEGFRPGEAIPTKAKDIIRICMQAYDRVGPIKNTVDLMGDFGCQGIKVVHPNPRVQALGRNWFVKVQGKERSERFLNLLYRTGNVFVFRYNAKLTNRDVKKMYKSIGKDTLNIRNDKEVKISNREIPMRYSFLNPLSIDIESNELSQFLGEVKYSMRASRGLSDGLKNGQGDFSNIPSEVVSGVKTGQKIPLKTEQLSVYHYKKDDWQTWAHPMAYAILDDLIILQKMKLADLAALDGAISNIRLWKLGDLEKGIMPTQAAVDKLSNILTSNVGGGTLDLVWGPAIDFKESSTQVFRFLGKEKYGPTLSSIYAGLGIPPSLTGAGAGGTTYTNNAVSLKTLIERLEYGRSILVDFWKQELAILQKALGIAKPFEIHFDRLTLSDEAAEKALLVQLLDRDIISSEAVLERFGELPNIEKERVVKEHKSREDGKMVKKASPWHNPQQEFDFAKLALQSGIVSPSEVGLELKPKKTGEKRALDFKVKPLTNKKTGIPSQGRPKNSKDSFKRKNKRVLPKTKGSLDMRIWASETHAVLGEVLTKWFLCKCNKKNLRNLSVTEALELEDIKFAVLCNIKPLQDLSTEQIEDLASTSSIPNSLKLLYANIKQRKNISYDVLRQQQIMLYLDFVEQNNE